MKILLTFIFLCSSVLAEPILVEFESRGTEPSVHRIVYDTNQPEVAPSSYGFWRFIKQIKNQKGKILFSAFFIITHTLYLIPLLNTIYFSQEVYVESPLPVSSQLSLNEPIVYLSSLLFVLIFVLICLNIKLRIPVEKRKVS